MLLDYCKARCGHRSIAISPASMSTNGADSTHLCKIRHDSAWWSEQSPHVRGAHLSRSSLLLEGKKSSSSHSAYHETLSEINRTGQSCSKTCLLKIYRWRFMIHNIFLFVPSRSTPEGVFRLYVRHFVRYHLRQALTYSWPRSAVKIWNRNSMGKWYGKPLKGDKNRDKMAAVGTLPMIKLAQIYIMR